MSSTNQQKKKQDEKNSKLVRELAALPANKYCFECGQRGPTYVNITYGSFCCMHCSGILRGLNPPHRVKSISMATFSNEEIEKLKSMGNEENNKVWLGLHDGPIKFEPVRLDENVKQHLIQKYERKRWYVSPSEIAEQRKLLEAHSQRRDSTSGLSINSHKSNQSAPANLQNLQPEKKNDLIDILGEDLMFPVKEEPANTNPSISSSIFSSSFTAPPPFFPPPTSFSSSSNNPLSSHSNTPQPLQFDLFGAPTLGPVAKVSSPPAMQMQQQPQQQNTFDFFGPPPPAQSQPKAQDNFANFDAVFNNFSISEKPAPPLPQTQPVSNGFLSSTPNIQPVLEAVIPSQPFESSLKPEPPKEVKKDDGLPDYSALEALYHAEDEPVDFFGFGKASNNIQSNQSTTTLSAATATANGFAKSKTTDFGYQSPFPSSNNFGNPNVTSTNTGLTSNPFFSMNSFQPSAFSTPQQTTSTSSSHWLPSTTTSNGTSTTPAASPFDAINAHQRSDWNPFG